MGIGRLIFALTLVPCALHAESLTLSCGGEDPRWTLDLAGERARFAYLDRESTLDIPQLSIAEGTDWPRAMTIVGPRDSAIVILHQRECLGQTHEAQVLTQRGETPILLTGCCR